jgi:hypothetical protein
MPVQLEQPTKDTMSTPHVPSKEEVIRWLHRINITGGLGMDAHAALDNALLYLRSAPEPPQASKDAFEAWLNTPGPATSPDNPYTVTLIRHLYEAWCAAWRARAAHEPPAAPVAYRKFIDSAYERHPRYTFREDTGIGAPEGWEALYTRPAPPPRTEVRMGI